jgi:hypothetical protein
VTDAIVVTVDVDWAPDRMVERMADALEAAAVPATWFVTHESPALARLRRRRDLFELGIHPNFAAGSTHGATPAEVLDHLMSIVPEARVARSHGVLQSGALLAELVRRTPVRVDSSTFLPDAPGGSAPVLQHLPDGSLVRVPFVWADDHESVRPDRRWDAARLLERRGPAVLLFHPLRVCLNVADEAAYAAARGGDRTPRAGPGAGSAWTALLAALAGTGRATSLLELACRIARC